MEKYQNTEFIEEKPNKTSNKGVHLLIQRKNMTSYDYSLEQMKTIGTYEKVDHDVVSDNMAHNKKSFYEIAAVKDPTDVYHQRVLYYNLHQFSVSSSKCVKVTSNLKPFQLVLTDDDKHLIFVSLVPKSEDKLQCEILVKKSRNLKLIRAIGFYTKQFERILGLSQDNKFLFIGVGQGKLTVVNVEKGNVIQNIDASLANIVDIAFFRDKKSAIVCDGGKMKKIHWDNQDVINSNDFQILRDYGSVSFDVISEIRLSNNDENLVIRTHYSIRIFNFGKNCITKTFKLLARVKSMDFFDDGKKVIVAVNGSLIHIIDMDLMEISKHPGDFSHDFTIYRVRVIFK